MSVYSADAAFASKSTRSFSSLRIYMNLTENLSHVLLLTKLKYFFICSPFAS